MVQQSVSRQQCLDISNILIDNKYSLHSHQVNYPRSSGYQSVTGFQGDNDYNSLWTIK